MENKRTKQITASQHNRDTQHNAARTTTQKTNNTTATNNTKPDHKKTKHDKHNT